jgi:hypothetical protein
MKASQLSGMSSSAWDEFPPRLALVGLFLLSAASLIFEINLTRLFSIAQFYHFAFMIVSLALLGFGASGTFLAIFPKITRTGPERGLSWLSLAAGIGMLGAYLLTNWVPFDSFSIAWDRKQVLILILHYVVLALPFFFSGMATGLLLSQFPRATGQTYAVNLCGSSLGCLAALVIPARLGGEGSAVLSSGMAALAAVISAMPLVLRGRFTGQRWILALFGVPALGLLSFWLFYSGIRLSGRPALHALDLHLSPYKGLSYALQVPQAQLIYQSWNAFSRVDVVRSPGIHSLPGLSYRYLDALPAEDGLLVDGDDLSPVVYPASHLGFTADLPAAAAFFLRPGAEALVLEPRGGLDVLTAVDLGAQRVTAVEVNPLILAAASPVYALSRVRVVIESDRSYIRRSKEGFDIIVLSLGSSYHPVRSGAYSLLEDYRYTVEAFQDILARLNPGGLLVVTRWLQTPPSEYLRAFALAVTAVERSEGDPASQIVAYRGYNTGTLLVKKGPFTSGELEEIGEFTATRAFDLVYTPNLLPEQTNLYNVLPEPLYYLAFKALLETSPRQAFYASYPFDITPPDDNHPFFGHYFKWSQAGQVLAEFGKTWQPFGGAGYFVILALLGLSLFLAALLILLPAVAAMRPKALGVLGVSGFEGAPPLVLTYFGWIGLGFLMVEIPLIQRFILYLGHPAYALTTVLFSLLLFSGLGSHWSQRIHLKWALAALVACLLGLPLFLPTLFAQTLGLPQSLKLGLTVLALAPLGFLMGIPFAGGLSLLASRDQDASSTPRGRSFAMIWAVNGVASVVSAVLAALLALTFGFGWVLLLGAVCYAGAGLTLMAWG